MYQAFDLATNNFRAHDLIINVVNMISFNIKQVEETFKYLAFFRKMASIVV